MCNCLAAGCMLAASHPVCLEAEQPCHVRTRDVDGRGSAAAGAAHVQARALAAPPICVQRGGGPAADAVSARRS